jgi:acyl-CoA thioesterase
MLVDEAAARVDALRSADDAIEHLGIQVISVSAGSVELALTVEPTMANGHRILHGGYLFLLADTALAYCCASLDRASVTRTADIAFLAPVAVGATVSAVAEVRVANGRTTICDVRLESDGIRLAEFRGHAVLAR